MLFRKRRRRNPVARQAAVHDVAPHTHPQLFHIAYEMMLKGSVCMRNGQPIRQYCVVAGGLTRLVTSGDVVDGETYEALLAAGAIKPVSAHEEDNGAILAEGGNAAAAREETGG